MRYLSFLFIFFILHFDSSAQTRRTRENILSDRVDSLSKLLKNERKANMDKIIEMNSRIQYLEKEIKRYDSTYSKTQSELNVILNQSVIQKGKLESKEQYILRLENELANAYANQSVKIGNNYWMSQNLNVTTFRNGDPIYEAKSNDDWMSAAERKQPAWCFYENLGKNGTKYGRLYNWYAVTDPRGLAPKGWKIPTLNDWDSLFAIIGGIDEAALKMKNENGWEANGNGTNETGFSALPGGYRDQGGVFYYPGIRGFWWASTEQNQYNAICLYSDYYFNNFYKSYNNKKCGLSVRCIRE